jgi:hypothetical protein
MSNPWLKFYPSDWRSDPALRICSIGARGLWMEMLCLMHEASPIGSLVVNGKQVTERQLAALSGASMDEVRDMLGELEAAGVFSREDDGTIYSRRMRRDVEKAERDKLNGGKGGNKSLLGVNPPVNPPVNVEDKAQKPEARSQKDTATLPSAPASDLNGLEAKCRQAANAEQNPSPSLFDLSPVIRCLTAGASLELDVLPAIRQITVRGHRWSSWRYAEQAIMDAKANREAPAKPGVAQPRGQPTPFAKPPSAKRLLLDELARRRNEPDEPLDHPQLIELASYTNRA